MQWELIEALVIAIPVILFPVAFVWYLNLGGLVQTVREAHQAKAAQKKEAATIKVEAK